MELATRQEIIETASRVFGEACRALELEYHSYEHVIEVVRQTIRVYGNKTISAALLEWIAQIVPADYRDVTIQPENLEQYVSVIDTREKAEALLLTMDEPDHEQLEAILKFIKELLPGLRQVLLPFAKRLPHPAGGRPKVLIDPAKRQHIRDEIGLLLAKGVDLRYAQQRLADKERVGLRKIQDIWRENRKSKRHRDKIS